MSTHPKIALVLVICLSLLTHSANAQTPDPRFGLVDSFANSAAQRQTLVPTVLNTPAPPTATMTAEPATTIEPTTSPAVQPPPTLTPTHTPTVGATTAIAVTISPTLPAMLPNSEGVPLEATITPVPPVTLFTILRPERLLWLLLIGLMVFMVSYGVQVIIWYRWKQ